jgi:flagellar basal-body rod protein FlgF
MIRGISLAASAMVARSRQQDALANNLANAETAGFKRQSIFMRRLEAAQTDKRQPWLIPLQEGNYTDFTQGPLDQTGDPLHLALEGSGFFVVETPEGERFTRGGNFSRSEAGELVTADGFQVLGDSGPITLTGDDITIGEHGEISDSGVEKGKLRIVNFTDPQALTSLGRNLFFSREEPQPDSESVVRQGYIERANFDLVHQMVEMMTTFRYFETAQKAVQIQDATLDRAVNQVGRLQR